MRGFIFSIFLLFAMGVNAQIANTAITPEGKHVVLLHDGSWYYADEQAKHNSNEQINSYILKDTTTNMSVVVEGVSEKLKKYFKYKNIVRAEFAIKKHGESTVLQVNWKIQTPDAFSYFGFINHKCKMILNLMDGTSIDLVYDDEFQPKEFAKYGVSTYTSYLPLSDDVVNRLATTYMSKFTMVWKRRTEEYTLKDPLYFVNTIPSISK